jgi:hypothetical protein
MANCTVIKVGALFWGKDVGTLCGSIGSRQRIRNGETGVITSVRFSSPKSVSMSVIAILQQLTTSRSPHLRTEFPMLQETTSGGLLGSRLSLISRRTQVQ